LVKKKKASMQGGPPKQRPNKKAERTRGLKAVRRMTGPAHSVPPKNRVERDKKKKKGKERRKRTLCGLNPRKMGWNSKKGRLKFSRKLGRRPRVREIENI